MRSSRGDGLVRIGTLLLVAGLLSLSAIELDPAGLLRPSAVDMPWAASWYTPVMAGASLPTVAGVCLLFCGLRARRKG